MTTATAKHSPGPWRQDGSHTIVAADETVIARLQGGGPTAREQAQLTATASLIIAAPDLLEACEASLAALRSIYDAIEDGADSDDLTEISGGWPLSQLRAAIAAAEGRP